MTARVMVIGGTGGFGRRLVEGLVATTDLEVIIGVRLAVRTIVVRDGVELLQLLGKHRAAHARHPGERRHLDATDLIVHDCRVA